VNKQEYDSPRVWREFRVANIACCENRVAQLMRFSGLIAVHKNKFCVTTHSKHNLLVWSNILNRNFSVAGRIKHMFQILHMSGAEKADCI
jgi:hypothetical protein